MLLSSLARECAPDFPIYDAHARNRARGAEAVFKSK
jgi:hypothetical protein